ncbi:hypothetical protein FACS1894190_02780 [Spirochaetia bacterium]|nr:hypothetical protein FACS1894190_02780 [Spirochaetia bacterium]GHV20293.1 hypothetical protein FACS189494_03770 [Spirochaetia bacterium]
MIVNRIMTKNPVFIHPDMPVSDARSLMDKEKIGRLPVLDKENNLIGIVTKKDMLKAGPSPATSLDMYEISYLLSKLKVDKVMTKKVITVEENEVVEEAARIMSDNDISCLPIMRGKLLVGIITGKDLFRAFVKAFGAGHDGVRITFSMEDKPGQIAKLSGAIGEKGGNIIAFVSQDGDDLSTRRGTLKIAGLDKATVQNIVAQVSADIIDIR